MTDNQRRLQAGEDYWANLDPRPYFPPKNGDEALDICQAALYNARLKALKSDRKGPDGDRLELRLFLSELEFSGVLRSVDMPPVSK